MIENVRKRVSTRVIVTIILAIVLAVVPPILYHDFVYAKFFNDGNAKEMADQYLSGTQWIHLGGIVALWLMNLIFFIINQNKGDCGKKLIGRTSLQDVLNIALISLSFAAMFGYRYVISSEVWIGEIFGAAPLIKAIVWMPYYIFLASGLFLWCFCRRAAPATNCPVTCKLAKWLDDKMKRAERTR